MSHRPGVHEIFSKEAQWKNNAFQMENQESKQQFKLSKKKVMVPVPPMKQFGGYVPKILTDETNFLHREEADSPTSGTPKLTSTSQAVADEYARPHTPVLAKIKPWIIGDKNVPMFFGVTGDENNNNDNDNQQTGQSNIYATINDNNNNSHGINNSLRSMSITSDIPTLHDQNCSEGINVTPQYGHNFVVDDRLESTSPSHDIRTDTDVNSITYDHCSDSQDMNEPDEVVIPAPDYDEEEKTVDFNAEDSEDSHGYGKPSQVRPRSYFKMYEGADLSHYLHEDDAEQLETPLQYTLRTRNALGNKGKSDIQRLSDKHSMFKQKPASKNKRKQKGKGTAPTFNSVRSFSYADSKLVGTEKGESNKSLSLSDLIDDSDMFLRTNTHQSSYEQYLRSRHGEAFQQDSSDSGVDVGDDGHDSKLRNKDDTIWRKLTLRFKHRLSKSLHAKEH